MHSGGRLGKPLGAVGVLVVALAASLLLGSGQGSGSGLRGVAPTGSSGLAAGALSGRSLETILVSNTDPEPDQSRTVLRADHRYRLVGTGTVSDWCDGGSTPCTPPLVLNQGVDSLYCYAKWRCPQPELWRQLQVNGVGLDELAGKAGKIAYSASHVYTVEVTGIAGQLSLVAADAAAGSAGGNSGKFTLRITDLGVAAPATAVSPGDRMFVVFAAQAHPGLVGRLGFVTVGTRDADGGYAVKPAHVGGSYQDLTITRGVFGQHIIRLAVVSGRYYPSEIHGAVQSNERIRLRVRVESGDSSCPVGAQGSVWGVKDQFGDTSAEITLCGEDEVVSSEDIHVNLVP